MSEGLGWGLGDPVCALFSPSAITEAHASAGPGRGMQGSLTSMVCVADLAAHHVPLTEDTGRGMEGRRRVRDVGPSPQSPDISTVASAERTGSSEQAWGLSRALGRLQATRTSPNDAALGTHNPCVCTHAHTHTPPPSVRGQTPAPGSTHTVRPGATVCQGHVPHRALP